MTDCPLRVVIADDEPPGRQELTRLLGEIEGVSLLAVCANGYEVLQAVPACAPDLLMLDIQMPGLNGFEVLEMLGDQAPPTVFVTAHDSFALQAFDARALDYVLKPVRPERLRAAVDRVRDGRSAGGKPHYGPLVQAYQHANAPLARLLVRDGGRVHVIRTEEITYLTAEDDYVRIHTARGNLLKADRLSRLATLLDPHRFCQIHRSVVINLDFLAQILTPTPGAHQVVLRDGSRLPLSRSGLARLNERL